MAAKILGPQYFYSSKISFWVKGKFAEFQISDKLAMLYIDKDISLLKGKKCSDFEVLFINSDSNKRNQKNRPNSARQSYR